VISGIAGERLLETGQFAFASCASASERPPGVESGTRANDDEARSS